MTKFAIAILLLTIVAATLEAKTIRNFILDINPTDREIEDRLGLIKGINIVDPNARNALKELDIRVHPEFRLENLNVTALHNLRELRIVATEKGTHRETLNLTDYDTLRLKKLSIGGIELREIIFPDCGLSALEKIEFVGGKLASFNLTKLQCSRTLEKLNLAKNELTEFGINVPCFLHDLEVLDLSANMLSIFNSAILSCSTGLKRLYLNDNVLDSFDLIHGDGICSTPRLKELNLANNLLKSVSMKQFSCARKLSIVDLRNNQLMSLDLGVDKTTFPRLNYFFLTNNNWTCDGLAQITGNKTEALIAFATPDMGNIVCKDQEMNGICCNDGQPEEEVKVKDIVMPVTP